MQPWPLQLTRRTPSWRTWATTRRNLTRDASLLQLGVVVFGQTAVGFVEAGHLLDVEAVLLGQLEELLGGHVGDIRLGRFLGLLAQLALQLLIRLGQIVDGLELAQQRLLPTSTSTSLA